MGMPNRPAKPTPKPPKAIDGPKRRKRPPLALDDDEDDVPEWVLAARALCRLDPKRWGPPPERKDWS